MFIKSVVNGFGATIGIILGLAAFGYFVKGPDEKTTEQTSCSEKHRGNVECSRYF